MFFQRDRYELAGYDLLTRGRLKNCHCSILSITFIFRRCGTTTKRTMVSSCLWLSYKFSSFGKTLSDKFYLPLSSSEVVPFVEKASRWAWYFLVDTDLWDHVCCQEDNHQDGFGRIWYSSDSLLLANVTSGFLFITNPSDHPETNCVSSYHHKSSRTHWALRHSRAPLGSE